MTASGSTSTPADPQRWPVVAPFPVLGHLLEPTGSIRSCWASSRRTMWRAFWANPASKAGAHLSVPYKLDLLNRCVKPQFAYKCSRWPPQRQIALELDKLQQKMTATVMRVPRVAGEDIDVYVRRRGRIARNHCVQQGRWSDFWFGRAIQWDDHLARERNSYSWSARLRDYRGMQWLMDRRASLAPRDSNSVSIKAGRTATRAVRGKVHARWHDGIEYARGLQ